MSFSVSGVLRESEFIHINGSCGVKMNRRNMIGTNERKLE